MKRVNSKWRESTLQWRTVGPRTCWAFVRFALLGNVSFFLFVSFCVRTITFDSIKLDGSNVVGSVHLSSTRMSSLIDEIGPVVWQLFTIEAKWTFGYSAFIIASICTIFHERYLSRFTTILVIFFTIQALQMCKNVIYILKENVIRSWLQN